MYLDNLISVYAKSDGEDDGSYTVEGVSRQIPTNDSLL